MKVWERPPDNVDELDYPRHEWVAAQPAPRAGSRDRYVSTPGSHIINDDDHGCI